MKTYSLTLQITKATIVDALNTALDNPNYETAPGQCPFHGLHLTNVKRFTLRDNRLPGDLCDIFANTLAEEIEATITNWPNKSPTPGERDNITANLMRAAANALSYLND